MPDTNASKWRNVSAGPRQAADFNKAVSALRQEGATHDELSGVIGGREHRASYWSPFSGVRPEVTALDEEIRAKYAGQVTRENVRQIIADYEAALPKARESRPVDDQRITPEEDAERRAKVEAREAAERAEREQRDAILNAVMAKAPRGARALIIAEYHEDTSNIQADYFGSKTTRTVAIGWRYSAREDFRALRSAAAQFPETAHMGSEDALKAWNQARGMSSHYRDTLEHRDRGSMSAGNYLSDHGWSGSGTGWVVKSAAIPCKWVHLTEDAIPDAPAAPAATEASDGAVTVSPSSLGRPGVIELRFAEKFGDDMYTALTRGARFRWARGNRCWYGQRDNYERARATWPELPELPGSEPEPGSTRVDVEGQGYALMSAEDMHRLYRAGEPEQAPALFAATA